MARVKAVKKIPVLVDLPNVLRWRKDGSLRYCGKKVAQIRTVSAVESRFCTTCAFPTPLNRSKPYRYGVLYEVTVGNNLYYARGIEYAQLLVLMKLAHVGAVEVAAEMSEQKFVQLPLL